jgi:hypothetical protein
MLNILVQCSAVQCRTTQHSTAQHSTAKVGQNEMDAITFFSLQSGSKMKRLHGILFCLTKWNILQYSSFLKTQGHFLVSNNVTIVLNHHFRMLLTILPAA